MLTQREKQTPRRDAWDRDYMSVDWIKKNLHIKNPKTNKRIENANLFLFLHCFM